MDITSTFASLIPKEPSHRPFHAHPFTLETLSSFLQEAYSIHHHITELHTYIRSIRAPYLALGSHRAPPPTLQATSRTASTSSTTLPHRPGHTPPNLTDEDRKAIESSTTQLIGSLSAQISGLAATAQAERDLAAHIAEKSRAKRGLGGALGRWAAGGSRAAKSPEELAREAAEDAVRTHRDAVVWLLQKRLEMVVGEQRGMVEIRLQRTVERGKSRLDRTSGDGIGGFRRGGEGSVLPVMLEEESGVAGIEDLLSPDQIQMFQEEQDDMVKHFDGELKKISAVQTTLTEISQLQTEMLANLEMQSESIGQLVQDSLSTTENIGKGNKELKKASERPSTARMVFYATAAFCTTLVAWDLLI